MSYREVAQDSNDDYIDPNAKEPWCWRDSQIAAEEWRKGGDRVNWVDSMSEEQAEALASALNETHLEIAQVHHYCSSTPRYYVHVRLKDGRTLYIYTGEVQE